MLWVDKYCPSSFDNFSEFQYLNKISDNPPHLLLYGPSGSGKKTLAKLLLKQIFGNSADKIKIEQRSYRLVSKKVVELTIMANDNYIQFDAEEAKQNDRMIIQELFKEIVAGITIFSEKPFKIMVIENLSSQAQHALRRTMEKYSSGCRIILITKSLSEIVEPLKSRFLCIRVPSPSKQQIYEKLRYICQNENVQYQDYILHAIIEHTGRNWLKSISKLQDICMKNRKEDGTVVLDNSIKIISNDWHILIKKICQELLDKQVTPNFLRIRNYVYDIIGHCIDPRIIIKQLCLKLTEYCDESIKNEICELAAKYEHQMMLGSKAIFHIEAFILNVAMIFHKNIVYKTKLLEGEGEGELIEVN